MKSQKCENTYAMRYVADSLPERILPWSFAKALRIARRGTASYEERIPVSSCGIIYSSSSEPEWLSVLKN
ncbi:hypothetical protein KCP74_25370 [Salmonella enterica subsp. enterica]|nr:hypothetical protein KCP74_25370 [Salmonella enterica subsp. enterica]